MSCRRNKRNRRNVNICLVEGIEGIEGIEGMSICYPTLLSRRGRRKLSVLTGIFFIEKL